MFAAAPTFAHADERRDRLPDAMIGTWGWSKANCGEGDDGRIIVETRSVTFWAAAYDLQTITHEPDGTIAATARVREEGEEATTQAEIRLRLRSNASLHIRTETLAHDYARCAAR